MKKRKVPHIILRFSKHVPAAPTLSDYHTASVATNPTKNLPSAAVRAPAEEEMAQGSELGDAATRARKRFGSIPIKSLAGGGQGNNPNDFEFHVEGDEAVWSEGPQSPAKRKRSGADALGIGGRKGDSLVPPKKYRRSAAPKQQHHAGRASSQEEKRTRADDKRVLRSQDTKLTGYAEWLEPEDEDAVDPNAPITLLEGDLPISMLNGADIAEKSGRPSEKGAPELITAPNAMEPSGHGAALARGGILIRTIDLEAEARASKSRATTKFITDPLDEERFLKPHQAKVREEKRQRNLERERVVFQKSIYEKKLMNLKSEEWMKTFGLTTLIASEVDVDKTALEKRRAAMINDLETMLFKYNACKEEEKRRRLARGWRLSGSPANSSIGAETKRSTTEDYEVPIDDEDDDEQGTDNNREGLDEEVDYHPNGLKKRRQKPKQSKPKRGRPSLTETAEKPFTSFYENLNDRNAAIKGWRRAGRNLSAFGQPIPKLTLREFVLPQDILNDVSRQLRARGRVSR